MFASVLHSDENALVLISLGITEEFVTSLTYFYRRMSELNITDTEYALLTATTVLFSGKRCQQEGDICMGNHEVLGY